MPDYFRGLVKNPLIFNFCFTFAVYSHLKQWIVIIVFFCAKTYVSWQFLPSGSTVKSEYDSVGNNTYFSLSFGSTYFPVELPSAYTFSFFFFSF